MVIEGSALHKVYNNQTILHDLNIQLEQGQSIAISGPSGSGKSTLLHIVSGLLSPDSGKVLFNGEDVHSMSTNSKDTFRSHHMGFVFQFHHLLPEFTALENVCLPLLIQGKSQSTAKQEALSILELVGLSQKANALPSTLSGGEKQRTAIARAAVHKPKVIFADEPTGNLDAQTAQLCLSVFQSLQSEFNCSFIIATHDLSLASALNAHFRLQEGTLCKIQ